MGFDKNSSRYERLSSLFQPDTLIPEQYLETFRRRTYYEPEKRLMLAVLEDGIACFQKYVNTWKGRGKNIFRETEEWIATVGGEGVFAFDNVCETLGFHAEYLRRGLFSWKAANLERPATAKIYEFAPRAEDKVNQSDSKANLEAVTREAIGR